MTDTKKISSLQIGVLTFLLSRASLFPITQYLLKTSKQNIWMPLILGSTISIFLILMYIYITKYDNKLNIIELNLKMFGKIYGNLINLIIVLGVIISSAIILLNICTFIFTNYSVGIPIVPVSFLFVIVCTYCTAKGIETICRTSQILCISILSLFVISLISLIYYIDINNFKPLFHISIDKVLSSSYNYILFSVTPIFMLSIIPHKIIIKEKNYTKSIILGYISSLGITFLTLFSTIGILGSITDIFEYPTYVVLKQIEYFHFFERVENILSISWIFEAFVFIVITLYFLKKYVSSTFKIYKKKSNKFITILFSIILFLLSSILLSNSIEFKNLIINNYSYIILISLIIIPILIFIRLKNNKISIAKKQ